MLTCPLFDAPWADQTGPSSSPRMCIMRCGSCSLKPAVSLLRIDELEKLHGLRPPRRKTLRPSYDFSPGAEHSPLCGICEAPELRAKARGRERPFLRTILLSDLPRNGSVAPVDATLEHATGQSSKCRLKYANRGGAKSARRVFKRLLLLCHRLL